MEVDFFFLIFSGSKTPWIRILKDKAQKLLNRDQVVLGLCFLPLADFAPFSVV